MFHEFDDGEGKKPVLSHSAEQFADKVDHQNHRVKIYDTPKGLCMSCYGSLIFRSPKIKNEEWQIYCNQPNGESMMMPDDVTFCNRYEKKGSQSLDDMKKVATLIEKEDLKRVGFTAND